jgi:hypothetical protein
MIKDQGQKKKSLFKHKAWCFSLLDNATYCMYQRSHNNLLEERRRGGYGGKTPEEDGDGQQPINKVRDSSDHREEKRH